MNKKEQIAKQILAIENRLDSTISTTLWVSDLHGEGDKFARVLKESFGNLFQTCKEALPHYYNDEKILYIANIIRMKKFISHPKVRMDEWSTIHSLIDVLKYKIQLLPLNIPRNIASNAINKLMADIPISNLWYENQWFFKKLIYHLSDLILKVLLDRFVILGDIFDRGSHADKIIRIINIPRIKNNMDLIFGNHDILWMGAVAGNLSLIAEALRITFRYNHQDFLKRIGIDYKKLQDFATKTYPPEKITGNYKAKDPACRSMEKALSIIQFKLEEKTILKHPEYEMQSRLWLKNLVQLLEKKSDNLIDHHFPTLNLENPQELSREEKEIIQDFQQQFVYGKKIKELMRIFFERGWVYRTYNGILSIHALIPSTQDGEFEQVFGFRGKALLDYLQQLIQRVGKNYLNDKKNEADEIDLFFYLWCGKKSPFFGKDAMKTFERYFIKDKKKHKENELYWESNLEKECFRKAIKNDFLIEHIVYGHIPRDYKKGQKVASRDGFSIDIDGGFAEAYLNRGHALVQTPRKLYAIILHQEQKNEHHKMPESIEVIRSYNYLVRVKNLPTARILQDKVRELLKKL